MYIKLPTITLLLISLATFSLAQTVSTNTSNGNLTELTTSKSINATGNTSVPSTTKEPESTTTISTTITKISSSTENPTTKESSSTTPESTTSSTTSPSETTTFPAEDPFPKNVGNWSVNFPSKKSSCIIFQGAIQFQYPISIDGKLKIVDLPKAASASGSCEEDVQTLILTWLTGVDNATSHLEWKNILEIVFTSKSLNKYAIERIQYSLEPFNKSVGTTNEDQAMLGSSFLFNVSLFETNFNRSFKCLSDQSLTINGIFIILTREVQFEAFRPETKIEYGFSDPELCQSDVESTVTLIGVIVGALLIALIVVSLVIYLGLRYGWCTWLCCKRADGYQRLDE